MSRNILVALLALVGINAAIAGPLLIITDGLGMTRENLADSPFSTFTIPGIVLTMLGLAMIGAAIALKSNRPWALMSATLAGILLLGWIVLQILWVSDGRPLQFAILVTAVLIIVLSHDLRRKEPNAS